MKTRDWCLSLGGAAAAALGLAQCNRSAPMLPLDEERKGADMARRTVEDLAPFPGPRITSVSPAAATNDRLVPIPITGDHFRKGATVGGADCSDPMVRATSILCNVPSRPGSCGAQPVTVLNPDRRTATRDGGFRYVSAMDSFVAAPVATVNTQDTPLFVASADLHSDGKLDIGVEHRHVLASLYQLQARLGVDEVTVQGL